MVGKRSIQVIIIANECRDDYSSFSDRKEHIAANITRHIIFIPHKHPHRIAGMESCALPEFFGRGFQYSCGHFQNGSFAERLLQHCNPFHSLVDNCAAVDRAVALIATDLASQAPSLYLQPTQSLNQFIYLHGLHLTIRDSGHGSDRSCCNAYPPTRPGWGTRAASGNSHRRIPARAFLPHPASIHGGIRGLSLRFFRRFYILPSCVSFRGTAFARRAGPPATLYQNIPADGLCTGVGTVYAASAVVLITHVSNHPSHCTSAGRFPLSDLSGRQSWPLLFPG